jgi:hypothetical protein
MSANPETSVPLVPSDESDERRDWARYTCELRGKARPVTSLEASNQWPIRARDLSAGGIAVVASRRFEPGTLLSLTMSGPAGDDVAMPLVRVRRVTTMGVHWVMGCSWVDELEKADMCSLLGKLPQWQPASGDPPPPK